MTQTLSDTDTSLPAWLQEMTRALGSQASSVAGGAYTPYQASTAPGTYGESTGRIAGFNPLQQQAFQGVQANQGSWKPYTDYASQTIPQATQSYMNPYISNVMDTMATRGQRNLTENLLPQINSTFAGQGQFGSTRNADFTNRAVRDTNQTIMDQQAQLAQQGFTGAQNMALADLQRQANLGQQVSNLGYTDTGMLGTVGQQQQGQTQANMDLNFQDWTKQHDWQKDNLGWLSNIIRGLPVDQSAFQTQTTAPTAGSANQISPLASAFQGFAGARTLANPIYATPTQQAAGAQQRTG
jgi:hypothetical protein